MIFNMGDWTEKYRPKSLDEVVGNERAIIELRKWANSWISGKPKEKAIILSGKPGTGKTSSALALANDFRWTAIELNTSDARNAEKIKKVATIGSINETFSDNGTFISSHDGGRKLIILDEADNLYERAEESYKNGNDLSDKGGKKAIVDTIKTTNQPIILIVNDYYSLIKGGGESLKEMCKLIKFYNPYPNSIFNFLKRICLREEINVDQKVLQTISDRCKGDIRSAINDLQSLCLNRTQVDVKSLNVLGYRDREKEIFDVLREIFKTKNIKTIRESISHLDADPKIILLWINENLPLEYRDINDLVNGYEAISKADIFLGRTAKTQNYSLWSYSCDIMNGGVATSKTHEYPNDKYNFPTWLRERKDIKINLETREIIAKKISKICHNSGKKSREFFLPYFTYMFRNNPHFAVRMKNKLDLSEAEIKYLLGESLQYRLKEILGSKETVSQKLVSQEKTKDKDKKENLQQSLLDF
jgi:replication factor C large subunit